MVCGAVNTPAIHQVALAPRLEYSRRLLHRTAADLRLYAESPDRGQDPESERALFFCQEAVRLVDARLGVRSLNDISGTVTPAVWILRAASARLAGHLPDCSARLCELAVHLGSIAVDASQLAGKDIRYSGQECSRLLESAGAAAEGRLQKLYPDMERACAIRHEAV